MKKARAEFSGRGSCDTWMLVLPNWSIADPLNNVNYQQKIKSELTLSVHF